MNQKSNSPPLPKSNAGQWVQLTLYRVSTEAGVYGTGVLGVCEPSRITLSSCSNCAAEKLIDVAVAAGACSPEEELELDDAIVEPESRR